MFVVHLCILQKLTKPPAAGFYLNIYIKLGINITILCGLFGGILILRFGESGQDHQIFS